MLISRAGEQRLGLGSIQNDQHQSLFDRSSSSAAGAFESTGRRISARYNVLGAAVVLVCCGWMRTGKVEVFIMVNLLACLSDG
jgi:hypothetical protein